MESLRVVQILSIEEKSRMESVVSNLRPPLLQHYFGKYKLASEDLRASVIRLRNRCELMA